MTAALIWASVADEADVFATEPEHPVTSIGFTASRRLIYADELRVAPVLKALPPAAEYVTGGCVGGDAFIGRWLARRHPLAHHVVIVPADRSRVDEWWVRTDVELPVIEAVYMPVGTTYADRNQAIVDRCAELVAFPRLPATHPGSRRSGTWQTVRMAHRAGKHVLVDVLDESM